MPPNRDAAWHAAEEREKALQRELESAIKHDSDRPWVIESARRALDEFRGSRR